MNKGSVLPGYSCYICMFTYFFSLEQPASNCEFLSFSENEDLQGCEGLYH